MKFGTLFTSLPDVEATSASLAMFAETVMPSFR